MRHIQMCIRDRMKMFSSYTTGGQYEASGYGYGPGIGEDYDKLVMIVSRASGAPVVAGAMEYAASLIAGGWREVAAAEYAAARKAGLDTLCLLYTSRCV